MSNAPQPRHALAAAATILAAAMPSSAGAQTTINSDRGTPYYVGHVSVSGALFILGSVPATPIRRARWAWGGFDTSVEDYFNESSARLSDALAMTSVGTLPVASHWGLGVNRGLTNATIVYAEAHGANLALNKAVKLAVGRPRPYVASRQRSRRIEEYYRADEDDAYQSFYSGHSSAAFTAATTSSILFSLRSSDPWQRRFAWGVQFAAAGATASLRVVAGRHYRSDVLVGTLVGVGLGVAFPAAHGLDIAEITWTEAAVGGGAAVLGYGFVEVLREVGSSGNPTELPLRASWSVSPAPVGNSPGVVATGSF